MIAKKEKGLCYRCDEKFFIGHRCKNKELRVLLVSDDADDEGGFHPSHEHDQTPQEEEMGEVAELSLNTVVGFSDLGTIKIKWKIDQEEVIVLVDCGATHNFTSQKIVDKLKLPISETLNFGVIIGTGAAIKGQRHL